MGLVLHGNIYISKILRKRLVEYTLPFGQPPDNPLMAMSIREMVVIDMLCEGKWVKEIAGKLRIQTSTVSTYKQRIFQKLHVDTLLEMFCVVQQLKEQELLV